MVRHPDCCNTNQSANVLIPRFRKTRLLSQTRHTAAMILSGCFRTLSPTSHNSCLGPNNDVSKREIWCGKQHDSSLLLGHPHQLSCPNIRYETLFDNVQIILTRVVTQHWYLIAPAPVFYCRLLSFGQ